MDGKQSFQKESFLSQEHISGFYFSSQCSFVWNANILICDLTGIILNVFTKQIFLMKHICLEFYFLKFKTHI